jgi:hypothetical protein
MKIFRMSRNLKRYLTIGKYQQNHDLQIFCEIKNNSNHFDNYQNDWKQKILKYLFKHTFT